jgi:hypothetical protein
MKPPSPAWETAYAHDRRQHRHRCHCCKRILNEGEQTVVARVVGQKTWAIHAECAEKRYGTSNFKWMDAMVAWGNAYLRACGWKLPLTDLERARG